MRGAGTGKARARYPNVDSRRPYASGRVRAHARGGMWCPAPLYAAMIALRPIYHGHAFSLTVAPSPCRLTTAER